MKTLLTLIILCVGMQSQAQIQYLTGRVDSISYPVPKYDTTAVIMMVSDTTSTSKCKFIPNGDTTNYTSWSSLILIEGPVYWIRGYEVRKPKIPINGNRYYAELVCYLDSNKKPITYLVWESRRAK